MYSIKDLTKADYEHNDLQGREEMALDDMRDYILGQPDEEIDDLVHEVANNCIHIYNRDLWDRAPDLQGYIHEAIAEGFVDFNDPDFTLERLFMAGEFLYLCEVIHNNRDTLIYNVAIDVLFDDYDENKIVDDDRLQEVLEASDIRTGQDIEDVIRHFIDY